MLTRAATAPRRARSPPATCEASQFGSAAMASHLLAIAEDARSRLSNAFPSLLFLLRIGRSTNSTRSRLGLCVLHEPHARHGQGQDDRPSHE